MLCSIPPDKNGDPVYERFKNDIKDLCSLKWIGYLSATSVYGDHNGEFVDENSELGNTFLAKVCVENERNSEIFKVFEDIDIIQLRIGVVLQKKIINLLSLNLLLSLPVPGNKNHYFPWVHADDIVGFINHSLDNNLIGAFNLVGSELTTHDTFFKSILKHKKSIIPWVIFLPKFLIKFIFGKISADKLQRKKFRKYIPISAMKKILREQIQRNDFLTAVSLTNY